MKVIIGFCILLIISFIGIYWWVSTRWEKYYTEAEVKAYCKQIENTPKLPANFYSIWDKLNNCERHRSIQSYSSKTVWNEFILHKHNEINCWYLNAAYQFVITAQDQHARFSKFYLAWGIQKYATSEKCFDYVKYNENEELRRVDTTFPKLSKLTDNDEIIRYIAVSEHPSRFKHHPEKLEAYMNELRKKLNVSNQAQ